MKRMLKAFGMGVVCATAWGQGVTHRPPAVPLMANDPYFSVWSMNDTLTGGPVQHWSEQPKPMYGLARVDGKVMRWMGASPRRMSVDAMQQTSVEVTPLHTRYRFAAGGVELLVTFFTPLFPDDLEVMSRPVTYLSWEAVATDGRQHEVELLLDVDPMMAVNEPTQMVTWSRTHAAGLTMLQVGSRDQNVLNRSGDRLRIDWGYFHLVAPDGEGVRTELSTEAAQQFAASGQLQDEDQLDMPRTAGGKAGAAHVAVTFALGKVGSAPVKRHVELAYTQTYAIEYLGRKLREYWQRHGQSEAAMLVAAEREFAALETKGVAFDAKLTENMRQVGGEDYAYLTSLLFRQTIAAHKLVADADGTPMLFSKENDSNGCIDTVDVTYPSSPFFLLFNPELLKAQLEPLMRYAALPRWKFPFAPHDLGQYPLANGQVYGGGEVGEDDQMPVEESGNLLILVAALGKAEGKWDFAKKYMPVLAKWAAYLEKKGLDPENQLSTDDFSGHLAHNTNLSIKAIEALGAFAQIAEGVGEHALSRRYAELARKLPAKWMAMAKEGDHYRLAFDQPGTWSQKYNLVWDDLLDLHLFPKSVRETEWTFYRTQRKQYGLPLDNRKSLTKLDWEVWTATLADDPKDSADMMHRLVVWADATVSRVPTTDWYDAESGKQLGFQARSVVGGVFIKALADPETVKRWRVR